MMSPENFIYFLTAKGFFVGLIFALTTSVEPEFVIFIAIALSAIFYMIGLAGAGFFIRYIDLRTTHNLQKKEKEDILDMFIDRLEKREQFIRDSHNFIENLEREFLQQKEEEVAGEKR